MLEQPVSSSAELEEPTGRTQHVDPSRAMSVPRDSKSPRLPTADPGPFCRDESLFLCDIDEEYFCSIGQGVLRSPVMTPCQHEFCAGCISKALETRSMCPLCRKPLMHSQLQVAYKTTRMIAKLDSCCDHRDLGCKWTGKWGSIKPHLSECQYKPVPCPHPKCEKVVSRSDLAEHILQCPYKPVRCRYCEEEAAECDIRIHESQCPKQPVECEQCDTTGIVRSTLVDHIQQSCPNTYVSCPFAAHGCDVAPMKRRDLSGHLAERMAEHLTMLSRKVAEQDVVIRQQQQTITRLLRRCVILVDITGRGMFRSISEAIKHAETGDRVVVRQGVYRECLSLSRAITLEAEGEVTIENESEANVVMMRDSCKLSGFRLHQKAQSFFCIRIIGTDNETVVEMCDISSDHYSCIQVDCGADPVIRKCKIHDSKQCGVLIKKNSSGCIEHNDIFNNCLCNVYVDGCASPSIINNTIHDSRQHGIWVKQHGGGVITDNTIFGNAMSNIKVEEMANPLLRNNTLQ